MLRENCFVSVVVFGIVAKEHNSFSVLLEVFRNFGMLRGAKIHEAHLPSLFACRISSAFGVTFFNLHAGKLLSLSDSLFTVALASGIVIASVCEMGVCTGP